MRLLSAICIVAFAIVPLFDGAKGGDSCGCCPHCGCNEFKTVCKVVPQVNKTPKVEYCCKCEEICVPGRSQCVGTQCVTDCNGCTHEENVYQPTCGKVYTKKTLVKNTTTIEKCTYKCVAETVCCKCGCGASGGGYSSQSYAPGAPEVRQHVDLHPVHTQTN